MKQLLIAYHTQTGHTEQLASSVARGAADAAPEGVRVAFHPVSQIDVPRLLASHGVVIATPENFGYMSGGMKDFFDRVYYPCEGRLEGLPYAIVVSAGNDGQGACTAIRRIARGFPWREVHDAIVVKGAVGEAELQQCHDLGAAFATGLELGVF